MKVASVKIHNILGIDDFEITPKSVTRFEGKNAVGKTSALEAIKAALKGGHDATLLRNGAEQGQIVILLDDGLEIKKTVTGEKTDLSVKYPRSGVKIDKPQTHLNALTDALSVNPIEFLNAPAKDRAAYLLQAMPLKVTAEDLKDIYDRPVDTSLHAFTLLAAIDKALYDDRTGVNRLKDEKIKTAKQLGETLPLEEEGKERIDWAQTVKDLMVALTNAKNDLKNAKEAADRKNKDNRVSIDGKCRESISEANKIYDAAERESEKVAQSQLTEMSGDMNKHDEEYRKRLSDLESWHTSESQKIADAYASKVNDRVASLAKDKSTRDAAISASKEVEKSSIDAEESRFKSDFERDTSSLNAAIVDHSSKLAEAETKAKQQIKENATRDTIARVMSEAKTHEDASNGLTARLEALQALRLRILSNLPIPGVTVENGQVMKDGVVYDRLNTASQIDIAVAIAKLRAKDLGIVCVDGLECLDAENFKAFEDAMIASGLQCFITRVTDTVGSGLEVVTK